MRPLGRLRFPYAGYAPAVAAALFPLGSARKWGAVEVHEAVFFDVGC